MYTVTVLRKISYIFPTTKKEEKDFFHTLSQLLSELPNAHHGKDEIVITPQYPAQAFPVTAFASEKVSKPQLVFDDAKVITLEMDDLFISDRTSSKQVSPAENEQTIERIRRKDSIGEYREIILDNNHYYLLSIEELYRRLHSHIVRIDHTGINIPLALFKQNELDAFVQHVSSVSNLYRYPTGEPWLFILPATQQEYTNGISKFSLGREPKFEIVFDDYLAIPTIQIDIASDLSRKEVEKMLPEPYGISFSGLAEYFRTVYLDQPWTKLAIRFDIRFKKDSLDNSWNTGEWLVQEGGRVESTTIL